MANKELKTPQDIDEPLRSRNDFKKQMRTLQKLTAYLLPSVAVMPVIILLLVVIVIKTAEPEVVNIFYYINNDGIAVAQTDADATPTVSMTRDFVEGCMRESYSLTSAAWMSDLDDASYCFNAVSFSQFQNDVGRNMNDIFFRTNSRGFTTTSNFSTKFRYDAATSPGGNCSQETVNNLDHVLDCRVYEVSFDQNIRYLDSSGGQSGTIRRDVTLQLFIVPRSQSLNGMYVYQIYDNQ